MSATSSSPIFQDALCTVYLGEALSVLRTIPDASISAVITDPPYSSGGMTRGDRAGQGCRSKYQRSATLKVYDEFTEDNRDQRGFLVWSGLWMTELRRVTRPGAVIAVFSDWRQMPTMTDAMQVGGLVWRGIVPWIKKCPRPAQGRWASAAEYLIWGTNGARALEGPCLAGWFHFNVAKEKRHMTEKPIDLMHELLRIAWEPDAVVLDPFMGSGTTLKAAAQHGKKCIGIEINEVICKTAIERLREPTCGYLVP